MAFIAVRNQDKRKGLRTRLGRGAACAALAAVSALAFAPKSAMAQTIGSGDGVVTGHTILGLFRGGGTALPNPDPEADPIDLTGTGFAYIANPYIAAIVGIAGTHAVPYPDPIGSVTHNHPGMVAFGNVAGAAQWSTDNKQQMTGVTFPFIPWEAYQGSGIPIGWGVWPMPSHWQRGTGFLEYDYSAYTRVLLDGAPIAILGDTGSTLNRVQFVNNVLTTEWIVGTNVFIRQEIRLYRATAQIRWVVTNNDTAGHTVGLRWTVPVRPGNENFNGERVGFFFESPGIGLSNDVRTLVGSAIPDTLPVFGKRYDVDSLTDPPFAAQFRFRNFGATTPTLVYIADPFEMRPEQAGYDPTFSRVKLLNGIAVASYFGPFNLTPGASAEVIAYYGNGSMTERPDNDIVVAAEATASLQYNSLAANDPDVVGNTSADPKVIGSKFFSPSSFQVWGGLYNRAQADPQTSLNLTNVRATLTLPTGLAFAPRPGSSTPDTSEKVVGSINSDREGDADWFVRATAEAFGPLSYQVNFVSNELGARQINRVVNVPVTPFRAVTATSYQMIGFPFEFDPTVTNNADPATVVNGLTRPVDEPVSFFKWIPDPLSFTGGGRYERVNQLENGIGYFYRPNLTRTIFAYGVKPTANQAPLGQTVFDGAGQKQVILERGWNIVSNPYVYDIPLRALRFVRTENNPTATSQGFNDAVASGLLRGGIFFFDTAAKAYDFFDNIDNSLKPWEAYWIYTTARTALVYNLPTQKQSAVLKGDATTEPPTRGVAASGRALVKDPTANNWRLQLIASRQGESDKSTIIGASNQNLNDSQRILPKPPAPVSDYIYMGIVRSKDATRYAKDIRNGRGTQTWEVELTADKDGPVTLTWPNANTLPRRVELTLKEVGSSRSIALRNSSSLTVNATKSKPTRFVVTATTGASLPLTISSVRTIGGTRGQGTPTRSFVFNVNREATLSGVIKTLGGKTVATLATSRAAKPGENRFTWNGRAQDGSALPPGPYVVEITARSDEGDTRTVTAPYQSLD